MGRNAIVGQSGGPTAVINASLAGVFSACKAQGIPRIYGMCNGVQGLLQERLIDLAQAFSGPEDVELLIRTPSSYLGSCRYKLPDPQRDEQVYERLFALPPETIVYPGHGEATTIGQEVEGWGW